MPLKRTLCINLYKNIAQSSFLLRVAKTSFEWNKINKIHERQNKVSQCMLHAREILKLFSHFHFIYDHYGLTLKIQCYSFCLGANVVKPNAPKGIFKYPSYVQDIMGWVTCSQIHPFPPQGRSPTTLNTNSAKVSWRKTLL